LNGPIKNWNYANSSEDEPHPFSVTPYVMQATNTKSDTRTQVREEVNRLQRTYVVAIEVPYGSGNSPENKGDDG